MFALNLLSYGNDNSSDTDTNADYIFDEDTIRTYEIIVNPEDLVCLDEEPVKQEYVKVTIVLKERLSRMSEFGTRELRIFFISSRSSLFRLWYWRGTGWDRNSFRQKICNKLSLKVKFNTDDYPERKFFGLKKLLFHSMNNDYSLLRERLGYWIFREMGVMGPRSVHAIVKINGEVSGLYALVEEVDGRFTRTNFENGEGNLYKGIMPTDQGNNPYSEDEYGYVL